MDVEIVKILALNSKLLALVFLFYGCKEKTSVCRVESSNLKTVKYNFKLPKKYCISEYEYSEFCLKNGEEYISVINGTTKVEFYNLIVQSADYNEVIEKDSCLGKLKSVLVIGSEYVGLFFFDFKDTINHSLSYSSGLEQNVDTYSFASTISEQNTKIEIIQNFKKIMDLSCPTTDQPVKQEE